MNPDEYNLKIKITYNDKEYNFISKDIISLENLKEKSKIKFNLSKISNNLIEFSLKKDKNIKISTDDDIIKCIDDSNLEDLKLELNLSTKIDNRENNNQTTSELKNKEDYISKKNNLNNNNIIKENKNNISRDIKPKDEEYKKNIDKLEKIIKEKDEKISKYRNKIIEWRKKYEKLEKDLNDEKNRNHNFNNLNNELEEAKKLNSRLKKVINHLKEKNLELENKLKNQELNINQTLNSNQNNNLNINQNLSTKNNNLNINQNLSTQNNNLNINQYLSTPKPNQDNNNLSLENKNINKDSHIPATLKYKENNSNKKTESSGELNNKDVQDTKENITPNNNNINQYSEKVNISTPNPILNEKTIPKNQISVTTPKREESGKTDSENINDKKNNDIITIDKKTQLTPIGDTLDINKNDNNNINNNINNAMKDTVEKNNNNKIFIPKLNLGINSKSDNIIQKENKKEDQHQYQELNLNLNLQKNKSEKFSEIKMSLSEEINDNENGSKTERIDLDIVNKIREMDEEFKNISDEIIYEKYIDNDEDYQKTLVDLKLGVTQYIGK